VAKSRFARDGYVATTVRDITDSAGVNVALINRYFTSKEGLFEACLTDAIAQLDSETDALAPDEIAAGIARRIAGVAGEQRLDEGLLLLIRSSGDERVDELRRRVIRSISERLADLTTPPDDSAVLRAEIVLAAAVGVALLRTSPGVQPLASATAQELEGPLSDLVAGLLSPVIRTSERPSAHRDPELTDQRRSGGPAPKR
jgi:AcrR family transcriptional regulator